MRSLQDVRHRFAHEIRSHPLLLHGREITTIGNVTRVAGTRGGILVHRPVAVEVRQGDITRRYALPNRTRFTLRLLLVDALIVALALGARRWLVSERST